MECVAYLRVSTEKQAEEGNGLDSQKRDIENYCRKNQLIISDWYEDDGFTGSNMNRPALQRLINDCSKKKIKCVRFKLTNQNNFSIIFMRIGVIIRKKWLFFVKNLENLLFYTLIILGWSKIKVKIKKLSVVYIKF